MKWDAVGWEMVSVEIGGGFEGDVECERTTLMAQVASQEPFRPLFRTFVLMLCQLMEIRTGVRTNALL